MMQRVRVPAVREEAAMQTPEETGPLGPAPEVRFEDGRGSPVPLSALWEPGPFVLVFMRHLG
jgi:hypothetical protein